MENISSLKQHKAAGKSCVMHASGPQLWCSSRCSRLQAIQSLQPSQVTDNLCSIEGHPTVAPSMLVSIDRHVGFSDPPQTHSHANIWTQTYTHKFKLYASTPRFHLSTYCTPQKLVICESPQTYGTHPRAGSLSSPSVTRSSGGWGGAKTWTQPHKAGLWESLLLASSRTTTVDHNTLKSQPKHSQEDENNSPQNEGVHPQPGV